MRVLTLNLATLLYPFVLTNFTLGLFDLADFLVLIIFCMIVIGHNFKLKLHSFEKDYLIIICIFALLSMFLTLFNNSGFIGEILRSFRYILYFYVTAFLIKHNKELLINGVIFLISIHGLVCILGALNQQIFNFFADLSGYDKRWFVGRGNGLAASFDTAGFILIAGIIILSLEISFKNLLLAFFFVVCGFFTGRTFMYLGPVVFLVFFFLQWNLVAKYILLVTLLLFLFIFASLLEVDQSQLLIIYQSLGSGDGYYDTYGKLTGWLKNHEQLTSLFGNGIYSDTDVGYLKTWAFGGFLYMIFQLFIFILLPMQYLKRENFLYISLMTVIVLLYNFKIYAFYSTIFAPLYLIIFMLLARVR